MSTAHDRRRGVRSPAFTLLELLVSIGVIGLLVALLLPALAGARGRAKQTVSAANLRTIGSYFQLFTKDNREFYPSWDTEKFYTLPNGLQILSGNVWQVRWSWYAVIGDIGDWSSNVQVYLAPGSTLTDQSSSSVFGISSYHYSLSFPTRPELWKPPPPGAAADPAFLRPSRTDEVVFASQKVLLWEWELPYLRRDLKFDGPDLAELTPAAFADGHVNILRPSEALPAVVNPFLPDRPAERLAYTANGVRGRDLERR